MRHVHVATDEHRLLSVQPAEVFAERILPLHPVVQAPQAVLRIGRIDGDHEEVVVLERNDTPLMVMLLDTKAVSNAHGRVARENGGTRVAFLLGVVPIALIPVEGNVELSLLHLRFLQAEEVGVQRTEGFTKALRVARSQTIHIPRDKPHKQFNRRFFRDKDKENNANPNENGNKITLTQTKTIIKEKKHKRKKKKRTSQNLELKQKRMPGLGRLAASTTSPINQTLVNKRVRLHVYTREATRIYA